ncbi:hypothetical protein DRJ48_04320 [Candidatus Woesearchaeota archaeon]|nr:hypothetical protein [Candidatus Woesearchaeota archaeon]RLE42061.1 MAG: hypothetical protein DRJ48_04320 [Candidatus Woesearchaeota archaeon]
MPLEDNLRVLLHKGFLFPRREGIIELQERPVRVAYATKLTSLGGIPELILAFQEAIPNTAGILELQEMAERTEVEVEGEEVMLYFPGVELVLITLERDNEFRRTHPDAISKLEAMRIEPDSVYLNKAHFFPSLEGFIKLNTLPHRVGVVPTSLAEVQEFMLVYHPDLVHHSSLEQTLGFSEFNYVHTQGGYRLMLQQKVVVLPDKAETIEDVHAEMLKRRMGFYVLTPKQQL